MNPDRRSNSATRWAVTGGLALVLAAPGIAAAQTRYSGVVVFGTSLSDSGNAFVLVGDQNTPADFDLNPFDPERPVREGRPPLQQRRHMDRAVRPWSRPRRQRQGGTRQLEHRGKQLCGGGGEGLGRWRELQPHPTGQHVPESVWHRRVTHRTVRDRDGRQRRPRRLSDVTYSVVLPGRSARERS